jgi:hypothetical protein
VSRRTVLVCDSCGAEISKATGAKLLLTFADTRRAPKEADYCDECVANLPGTRVVRQEAARVRRNAERRPKVPKASQIKQAKKTRLRRKSKARARVPAGVGVIAIRSGHHRSVGDSKASSRSHRAFRKK